MVPSIRGSTAAVARATTPVIPTFTHTLVIHAKPQVSTMIGARTRRTIQQMIAPPRKPNTFVDHDNAAVSWLFSFFFSWFPKSGCTKLLPLSYAGVETCLRCVKPYRLPNPRHSRKVKFFLRSSSCTFGYREASLFSVIIAHPPSTSQFAADARFITVFSLAPLSSLHGATVGV